jgi:hypothetical protein
MAIKPKSQMTMVMKEIKAKVQCIIKLQTIRFILHFVHFKRNRFGKPFDHVDLKKEWLCSRSTKIYMELNMLNFKRKLKNRPTYQLIRFIIIFMLFKSNFEDGQTTF